MSIETGGVPMSVLKDLALNTSGEIREGQHGGHYLVMHLRKSGRFPSDGFIISPARLGISGSEDALGYISTTYRPANITEGLAHIDAVRDSLVSSYSSIL